MSPTSLSSIAPTLPPSFRFDRQAARLRLSPRDAAFVQDPYPAYAALHAQSGPDGPIFHWEEYGHWMFGGLDAVHALFRDKRLGRQILHLTSPEALGWPARPSHLANFDAVERHSLLELEPPDHTRLRGLITRAFVSRHIETLGPAIAQTSGQLLDGFEPGERLDMIERFAEPLAVSVIAAMLGIDPAFGPHLLRWSHAMVRMYQAERTLADEEAANLAAKAFADWVRQEVRVRRKVPGDDLLSHLVQVTASSDRLSEDEIVSTTILLLNAGHEATVHALGHGILALVHVDLPTRQAWLQNPDALTDEILRHRPPLHMFTRYVLEACELYGVPLKFGDRIGLHLGLANHDPRRVDHPARFHPTRKPVKHVAFGAGIHFCIGHALARLEMATALPLIWQRFPALDLVGRPRLKDAYHFHGFERLEVHVP